MSPIPSRVCEAGPTLPGVRWAPEGGGGTDDEALVAVWTSSPESSCGSWCHVQSWTGALEAPGL